MGICAKIDCMLDIMTIHLECKSPFRWIARYDDEELVKRFDLQPLSELKELLKEYHTYERLCLVVDDEDYWDRVDPETIAQMNISRMNYWIDKIKESARQMKQESLG